MASSEVDLLDLELFSSPVAVAVADLWDLLRVAGAERSLVYGMMTISQ